MRLTPDQAFQIYEAGTFLVQEHGVALDARLVIDFAPMGVSTEKEATAVQTAVGREFAQRLADWCDAGGEDHSLHRLSFLDRSPAGGLSGTLLFHLPAAFQARAVAWFVAWFARFAVKSGKAPYSPTLDFRSGSDPRDSVARQWRLLRPLWGSIDPCAVVGGQPLLDRLAVRSSYRGSLGDIAGARYRTSNTIGPGARRHALRQQLPHASAWRAGRWDQLFTGWELREYRERQNERERRAAFERGLEQRRAETGDPLTLAHINLIARDERHVRDLPPELRLRRRPLWAPLTNVSAEG
ncbi:hypothetical protein [Sphingomonas sp.]|uniref:hypothetical protein n=1 Tax=Sphingomonas sp. TaxID=28214 RepID=UPI003CC61F15